MTNLKIEIALEVPDSMSLANLEQMREHFYYLIASSLDLVPEYDGCSLKSWTSTIMVPDNE